MSKKKKKCKAAPLPRPKLIVPTLPHRFYGDPLFELLERERYRLLRDATAHPF